MQSDRIDSVVETFHDFDLIDIYSTNNQLHVSFRCYWNQMNDENNPWMHFKFIFPKTYLVEYELFSYKKDDSIKFVFKENDNSELYKNLIDSEIYFNNVQYLNDEYVFGCGGNQENCDIISALVKFRFNSDEIIILDGNNNELTESEYFQLYNDWWNFVKR